MIVKKVTCDMCGKETHLDNRSGWLEIYPDRESSSTIIIGVAVNTQAHGCLMVTEKHNGLDFCSLDCSKMWLESLYKEKTETSK